MQTPPPSPDIFPTLHKQSFKRSLILVSNRLPITVKRTVDGQYDYQKSGGGLVSGMSGIIQDTDFRWCGWPGITVSPADIGPMEERLREEHRAVPIFVDEELSRKSYNGFSSQNSNPVSEELETDSMSDSALWPLLHYQSDMLRFHNCDWEAYCDFNRKFAVRIASEAADGDYVWIHDYHLMLLPAMLFEEAARRNKQFVIGFFLHTPFPSGDMFKVVPVWRRLLESVLHSDLIGFHTSGYANNFKRTCQDLLGLEESPTGLVVGNRTVHVGVFPIGIEPQKFIQGIEKASVKSRIVSLSRQHRNKKVIIGVDRLDYIKGIPQKLAALDLLLQKHPEWIGRLVLIQVAIPSREDVKQYRDLGKNLRRQVKELNQKYGFDGYQPVHFMHRSVSHEELVSLYAVSDVCFISSIRDGMNLVACEYTATQKNRHGVLLLSEFAGATEHLRGSLQCNPWDVDGMADAMHDALTMGQHQRAINHRKSEAFVLRNTSAAWGRSFVSRLQGLGETLA